MFKKRITTICILLAMLGLSLSLPTPASAATYVVTNTYDSGVGSLRWAIQEANTNPAKPHTIEFNIPNPSGAAVVTIRPLTPLPSLYGEITIAGETQRAFAGDTNPDGPEIELDGSLVGTYGLYLSGMGNHVRELIINRFGGPGVQISGATLNRVSGCYIGTDFTGTTALGNGMGIYLIDDVRDTLIGGTEPEQRNLISGNLGSGIVLANGANTNQIWGNIIGADQTGTTSLPNQAYGILLTGGASDNMVGSGEHPNQANLISGNGRNGVFIEQENTRFNVIEWNIIGLDITKNAPLPNGWHGIGIYYYARENRIAFNTIGANSWSGIAIVYSYENDINNNYIGANIEGITSLGNNYFGIDIYGGASNLIHMNTIAYNGLSIHTDGIRVRGSSATSNRISENSIHDNGDLGIKLVSGGNNNLLAPDIKQATWTTVSGTTSPACVGCIVEVFSEVSDEGEIFQGVAVPNGVGDWSWTGTVLGPNVTVTLTDPAGNTSQFSLPCPAGSSSCP